jgi:hypothetical protein
MALDEKTPFQLAIESELKKVHDALDDAWLARKSPAAPIALGILSVLLSPLLLGLFFGPLGLRAGLDLRRRGVHRVGTGVAIVSSLLGIVLSVATALLWGSILAGVLLGRDAMRQAEAWRGRQVPSTTVQALVGGTPTSLDLARPAQGAMRQAILIIEVGQPPCHEAVRTLSEVSERFPEVPVLVIDRVARAEDVWNFVRMQGTGAAERFICVGDVDALPAPLDQAAAIPTFLVIDKEGSIEKAIVGLHPAADVEKLMGGAGALPAESPQGGGG